MWELWAKFFIQNSATCWSFLVCELQGPFYSTSMNCISISVMVRAQGQGHGRCVLGQDTHLALCECV